MRLSIQRIGFYAVATVLVGALTGGAGPAAAQSDRCANPMATCAGPLSQDCLQRLGAGVISAEAAGCADQLSAYRSCLAEIVETCGASQTSGGAACDSETARILWDDVKQADDCLAYEGYRDACPDTPQARVAATRLTRLGCASTQRGAQADADAPAMRALVGHDGAVGAVVYVDANRALSASSDKTLKLWDLDSGALIRTLSGHGDGVWDVAATPGGMAVSAGQDDALLLWSLESGAPSILGRHSGSVRSVVVTPDGALAVSLSSGVGDGLKLWDLDQRRGVLAVDKVFATSSKIAISPDGTLVIGASYDDDSAIRVFSLKRRSVLRNFEPGAATITAVAFSPDGRMVMIGRKNGAVALHETAGDRSPTALAAAGGAPVTSVAFGPLGALAISGSEGGTATLWSVRERRALQTLGAGGAAMLSVALSPDRTTVLTGAGDGGLSLWRIEAN